MTPEKNEFRPKQINAPETVLCMAQEGKPSCTVAIRITREVRSQYSPTDILVYRDTKRKVDLLNCSWATEGLIPSFHVDNGSHEFLGRTLWGRFAIATGEIKASIFTLFEQLVKFQKR